MEDNDVPAGHFVEAGSGVMLIVCAGAVVGLSLSLDVWEKIRAYRVPQSEIDALARASIAALGERAGDELIALANRARWRGETEEETVHIRVARAVFALQAAATGEAGAVRLRRRKTAA